MANREMRREHMKSMNAARKISLDATYKAAGELARDSFIANMSDQLFVSGLSLYWGEGDKRTRHQVRLTNTDPALVKIFLKFLLKYSELPLERVWVSLIRYPDTTSEGCEMYWQDQLGLGAEHFQKTVEIQGRGTERRSAYGICVVGISSSVLKVKMLTWIAELGKYL